MHGDMVAVGTRDATVMLLSYATGAIMRTFGSDGTGCVTHAGVESSQLLSFHQHASLWPTALQSSACRFQLLRHANAGSHAFFYMHMHAITMSQHYGQRNACKAASTAPRHTRMRASRSPRLPASLHSQSAHQQPTPDACLHERMPTPCSR